MKILKKAEVISLIIALFLGIIGCKTQAETENQKSESESSHTHTWDDGVVTKDPTCIESGIKTFTCKTCHQTKTESIQINPDGHIWDEGKISKRPTFEEEGLFVIACTLCKESKTEILPKIEIVSLEELGTKTVITSTVECTRPKKVSGSTYYSFGVYPQTIKEDSVIVDESVINEEITGAEYYLGNDGNWYAKCFPDACKDTSNYKYSNGKQIPQESTKCEYFKVEPIIWRKLGSNGPLLAEKALISNISFYDYRKINREVNGLIILPNNYEHSKVRAFLNGLSYFVKPSEDAQQTLNPEFVDKGFLQQAFTPKQQLIIKDSFVDNSLESYMNKEEFADNADEYLINNICKNTNDKIFILSTKEVTASEYNFENYKDHDSENLRIRDATDFALANFCLLDSSNYSAAHWFLRSPSDYAIDCSYFVYYDGSVEHCDFVNEVHNTIIPALKLK